MKTRPDAVIAARRSAGLTQEELARIIGTSEKTIRNIESGHVQRPFPKTLKSIADALEVAVADIAVPDQVTDRKAAV